MPEYETGDAGLGIHLALRGEFEEEAVKHSKSRGVDYFKLSNAGSKKIVSVMGEDAGHRVIVTSPLARGVLMIDSVRLNDPESLPRILVAAHK